MAFIRWRGGCAQLLTTIYEEKRSKQVVLANLPNFDVTRGTRNEVKRKYPDIQVDWAQINRVLAKGPPVRMNEKTPDEHLDMAEAEVRLRMWADRADDINDTRILYRAADVLTGIRQRKYFANLLPRTRNDGIQTDFDSLTTAPSDFEWEAEMKRR